MIISYPYLPEPTNSASEVSYRERIEACLRGHGTYPVSYDMCWHGGVHLYSETAVPTPVCAIADGEVIAYRRASEPVVCKPGTGRIDEDCDNSFVLLKHQTETGDGVQVVYYSLYMHLMNEADRKKTKGAAAIVEAVRTATGTGIVKPAPGTKVWRKDVLGHAGVMYRNQEAPGSGYRFFHFEIFTTDEALKAFWRDSLVDVEQSDKDGSKEFFGSAYYIIPAKTEFKDKHPDAGRADPKKPNQVNGVEFAPQTAGSNEKKLYVETHYDQGDRHTIAWEAQENGTIQRITGADGVRHPAEKYEYNLYDRACKLYPTCPSAGYELLRYGRILGPDTLPSDEQANWQPIPFAEGKTGYVNLSDNKIRKLSDADFPHWKGWQKIDESSGAFAADGICDALKLQKLLKEADTDRDGTVSEGEWNAFASGTGKDVLRRTVCRFPTEWDGGDNETRYKRLKEKDQPFYEKPDAYQAFIDHLKDLQFWQETGLPTSVWHFHPLEFIRHFRKCGWLSKNELTQTIPDYAVRTGTKKDKTGNTIKTVFWEEVAGPKKNAATKTTIANHRIPLNKMMRKYGVDTRLRQAALLGNSIQETQWLSRLSEGSGSKLWYAPWYGRGFLQLTNPGNYCNYWEWRGRTAVGTNLKKAMVDAYAAIEKKDAKDRKNTTLQDSNFTALTAEITGWRNNVEASPDPDGTEERFSPSDSAGFYWAKNKMGQYADHEHTIERHPVTTESGTKVYYRSLAFWRASAAVNLPSRIGRTDYSGLNGFDSRCCAYGTLIATLTEFSFPDDTNKLTHAFPEGYKPRRDQ